MDKKILNEEVVDDIIKELNINKDNSDDCNEKSDHSKLNEHISSATTATQNSESNAEAHGELDSSESDKNLLDDIEDEILQEAEKSLSEEDKRKCEQKAADLKLKGNEQFKYGNYLESINIYTEALNTCPWSNKDLRSIFYCNRAAAKIKLKYEKSAIDDCSKAIELNPSYVKAYMRRAKLYEAMDNLDESLKDFTKVLELDPLNNEARVATIRLPPQINERNEKLKEEMLGKLKDLGNMVLKPFGLSTDNFKLEQNPDSGGYSINFQQGRRS